MRSLLAGILLLVLSSAAFGQVQGFVESVGFDQRYRPGAWTPVVVNLKSQVSEPMTYQLQVWQEDLDKDRVVYTKEVTLSPQVAESYMLYFVPSASGLVEPGGTAGDLQKALRVRVCIPPGEGKKPDDAKVVIDRLPITFTITDTDPRPGGPFSGHLDKRLVLCISDADSGDKPSWSEYQTAIGLQADVDAVMLRPAELGENPLYYSSVDAVVWLNANADDLDRAGAKRREALEEYVRQGGRLVICQPGDRAKIDALAALMPVETKDATGKWLIEFSDKPRFNDYTNTPNEDDARDALPELARPRTNTGFRQLWGKIPGPIRIARATPKDSAVVDVWEHWTKDDRSPFIVRRACGLGCVTWVAQNLGDPKLTGPSSSNWPYIWDRVLGWRNATRTAADAPKNDGGIGDKEIAELANSEGHVDFSRWVLRGTDYAAKGAAYIFLAVLFFIIYWVAAGPGTYLFLAGKRRRDLNWFIFGAWAFVGTAMTVLLVRLVLRGDAEVRHLSVVRAVAGEPAVVYSRIGLYIPRDGDQTLALKDTSKDAISYLTPLQVHPAYNSNNDFPAAQVYAVPVHDEPQPVSISVPFRSTLKKLQSLWVGDAQAGLGGSARLTAYNNDKGVIAGTLTNQTGTDLRNVYVAFNYLMNDGRTRHDMVLFVQAWDKDKPLDLNAQYASAKRISAPNTTTANAGNDPESRTGGPLKGWLDTFWEQYWTLTSWGNGGTFSGGGGEDDTRGASDFDHDVPKGFPIMSLFDRIGPGRNVTGTRRVDFLRRGGHELDMSPALEAGKLVVLAQSSADDKPLPFPFTVDGKRVEGKGRVLYQFALPLDRSEMEAAAGKEEKK